MIDTRRPRRGRSALLAAALLAALAGAVGETGAAFSGVTANGVNSFTAAPPCTTQTVTATRDAWVRSDATGDNAGTGTTLQVKSQSGQNRRSLVGFTLPSAAGCTLVSATLRLHAGTAATGRTIQALQLAGTWTETGVTWATQPATTGTAATASSALGWVEFDTTTIVQAQYAGTSHGFLVRDATESSGTAAAQVYSSREGADPPQLVLTFS